MAQLSATIAKAQAKLMEGFPSPRNARCRGDCDLFPKRFRGGLNDGFAEFGDVDLCGLGVNGVWNSGGLCDPPRGICAARCVHSGRRREGANRSRPRLLKLGFSSLFSKSRSAAALYLICINSEVCALDLPLERCWRCCISCMICCGVRGGLRRRDPVAGGGLRFGLRLRLVVGSSASAFPHRWPAGSGWSRLS